MCDMFNKVINLCDEGINLLDINTHDKEQINYKIVITKHSDIIVHAFVGRFKYKFESVIKLNGCTFVWQAINVILDFIENNIDFVKIYD